MPRVNDRRGFALPAALLAMVIIGAIVTGGFYAAGQEARLSEATAGSRDAFYVAEQGVQNTLGTWYRPHYQTKAIGGDTSYTGWAVAGSDTFGRYTVTVRRLDNELYLVRSTGAVVSASRYATGTRTIAQMVRTKLWDIPMNGALNVYGGLKVSGTAYIDGADADAGICQPQNDAIVAGVVTKNASNIDMGGSGFVAGDPPVKQDTSLNPSSLLTYGDDVNYDKLVSMATIKITEGNPPNTWPTLDAAGKCNTADIYNWGEPRVANHPHACMNYMPIIHATASTFRMQGGVGQGILLVDGDLKASGGFTFHGIIIVKGKLETSGTGAHFNGVVVVNSDSVSLASTTSSATGSSIIKFSSCSAVDAMNNWIRAEPLVSRSWFDLTNASTAS